MTDAAATAPAAHAMLPRVARVKRRRREIPDTWTLELEPDAAAPGFAPGQFNMLYLPGVGEIPVSMSGDPHAAGLVHTVRAVGAVSGALAGLRRGDRLGVRGPFGSSWPLEQAKGRDVVVVAGGIGLAPLRPLLYGLRDARGEVGRVTLLYGARSPEDVLYQNELDRWGKRANFNVQVTVDHATGDWTGPVGVVTSLMAPELFDAGNAVAYLCGPEIMMRFAVAALGDLGLQRDAMYVSLERNMKCAVGHCGHCQLGPAFVCRDGPVFRFDRVSDFFSIREL